MTNNQLYFILNVYHFSTEVSRYVYIWIIDIFHQSLYEKSLRKIFKLTLKQYTDKIKGKYVCDTQWFSFPKFQGNPIWLDWVILIYLTKIQLLNCCYCTKNRNHSISAEALYRNNWLFFIERFNRFSFRPPLKFWCSVKCLKWNFNQGLSIKYPLIL